MLRTRTALYRLLIIASALYAGRAELWSATEARTLHASAASDLGELLPAVVSILVRKPAAVDEGKSGASVEPSGAAWDASFGSGFIIDSVGIVVTNYHVVAGAKEIEARLNNGLVVPARVLGVAEHEDLAVLRISAGRPLPVLAFGDSDRLQVGERVFAIGDPLGLGNSVTSGIASGFNRDIKKSPFDDYIQTDAAINRGNSGGPLVDGAGRVIGVNTAIYSPGMDGGSIGLGFAIPSNDARFIVGRILRYGRVKCGWIGVGLQDLTPGITKALGLPTLSGVIVAQMDAAGTAAAAGLLEGDVIRSLDGYRPADARDLMRAISRASPGGSARIIYWRDGREITVSVPVTEWPDGAVPADAPGPGGLAATKLRLSPITKEARLKYGLGTIQHGVVVTEVPPDIIDGGEALAPGDVILRVQRMAIGSPDEIVRVLREARATGHERVMTLVLRRGGQRWMPLSIGSFHQELSGP